MKNKKSLQNLWYERETAKHKEINATQYKVGNTAEHTVPHTHQLLIT